ncbi:galactose oxidase [Prochlorococcus marinus]|uniref:galactose oxidase n=1 Tax=Prochlorococcus marinus TaxID=1219 RepID=UPI0022B4B28B|nr:galactose oxidase [Prochlorococcus marinus]
MSSYRTQKVLPQKRYNPAEEWDYLEEDTLKHTRSASVCMTCQHFNYCCDRHCRTILTCHLHQRLIPHGDHLTSKCLCWMQRLERKIGWCPEAA